MSAHTALMAGEPPSCGDTRDAVPSAPHCFPLQHALAVLALSPWRPRPGPAPPSWLPGQHGPSLRSRALSSPLRDRRCGRVVCAPPQSCASAEQAPSTGQAGGQHRGLTTCRCALLQLPQQQRDQDYSSQTLMHQEVYENAELSLLLSCINSELVGEPAFLSQGAQTR